MAQDEQNEWLSTDDAKRHIGVSAATLYRLVDEGLLPAYRPSRSLRFRRRDLDAYLEGVRVRPGDLANLRTDTAGRRSRRQQSSTDSA